MTFNLILYAFCTTSCIFLVLNDIKEANEDIAEVSTFNLWSLLLS